jgi:C-terminal peptidase prc
MAAKHPVSSVDVSHASHSRRHAAVGPRAGGAAPVRSSRRWPGYLAAALAGALTACQAVPASLPSLTPRQAAAALPAESTSTVITREALTQAERIYLYPDRLDRRVLIAALNRLEAYYDPVRFDEDPADAGDPPAKLGTLWVRDESVRVPIDPDFEPAEIAQVLGRVIRFLGPRLRPEDAPRDDMRPADERQPELIALAGGLEGLDRYSTIFSGKGSEDFTIRLSGQLSGIGTRIQRVEGNLTAREVFPEGPAYAAGMRDGDVIEAIDGGPTRSLSVREAVDRIRGPAGSRITLRIARVDLTLDIRTEQDLLVTRANVQIPSVRTEQLGDGIGYARISTVSQNTHLEFRSRVLELGNLRGLVLDLRGNTGGYMNAAASLADYFLANEPIYRVVNRTSRFRGDAAAGQDASPHVTFPFPVVVLVDGSTASAAEILAGAIAPLDRVLLMGERTFGKGLIQAVKKLPGDNLLKLTTGEYLLSGDRVVQERGLDPDIELFPVSTTNLGRLALLPEKAVPYVWTPGSEDRKPIEAAQRILVEGRERALSGLSADWNTEIASKLASFAVPWREPEVTAADLTAPLAVRGGTAQPLNGAPTQLEIQVFNPNSFEIPDLWASFRGPVDFLSNKLVHLGAVPARGIAEGSVMIEPSDGLSISPLPIEVELSAGSHALQTTRIHVAVQDHPPALDIDVERKGSDQLSVTVRNRGCCGVGVVRVAVPSIVRKIESLGSGQSETVELPITGELPVLNVLYGGPGIQRTIEIPIPRDRLSVRAPTLSVTRRKVRGEMWLEVEATAADGLVEGWIEIDGEKQRYQTWNGDEIGLLETVLADPDPERAERNGILFVGSEGEEEEALPRIADASSDVAPDWILRTKVETLSGVAMYELRTVANDPVRSTR